MLYLFHRSVLSLFFRTHTSTGPRELVSVGLIKLRMWLSITCPSYRRGFFFHKEMFKGGLTSPYLVRMRMERNRRKKKLKRNMTKRMPQISLRVSRLTNILICYFQY